MNIDEIKAFLDSPEGEPIKQELTAGLARKKDELLHEKKTVKAELDTLAEKMSQYENQVQQLQRQNYELKADGAINSAMEGYSVRPELKPVIKQMVLAQEGIQVTEQGNFQIGNTPIESYMNDFFQSENGKHYLSAPMSNGGGSTGNGITTAYKHDYSGMSTEEIIRNATQK